MKKRKGKPKLANCSPKEVMRALKKMGEFFFREGKKHIIIIHESTNEQSALPRHSPINRYIMKDFVEDYLVKTIGYSEEEIYEFLWC